MEGIENQRCDRYNPEPDKSCQNNDYRQRAVSHCLDGIYIRADSRNVCEADWRSASYGGKKVKYRPGIDGDTDDFIHNGYDFGYNLLYTCNNREIKPLSERKVIPGMYIGVVECDLKGVTAKSEFPLRSVEDVPFLNVYEQEEDEIPFDISDIITDRKARRDNS